MAADSEHNRAPPAKRQKRTPPAMCCICRDTIEADQAPFQCDRCRYGVFCSSCLKDWFLKATVDETRMPVQCCDVDINPKCLGDLLSDAEVATYKAKHEEWSTFDKLYCPMPRCSAFIPAHLYLLYPETDKYESLTPDTAKRQTAKCPDCSTEMCTSCRGPAHPIEGGRCTRTQFGYDPLLEAQFAKWGVKRCPKCKIPVRLMYGCASVMCRCGHHFCFRCLQPIDQCDGRCEEEDEEHDGDIEDMEEEEGDIMPSIEDIQTLMADPRPGSEAGDGMESPPGTSAGDHAAEAAPQRVQATSIDAPAAEPAKPAEPAENVEHVENVEHGAPDQNRAEAATQTGDAEDNIFPSQQLPVRAADAQEAAVPEAPDLDAQLEPSDLDLGADPDEPAQWKCRHPMWTRMRAQPPLYQAGPCSWCKKAILPADVVRGLVESAAQGAELDDDDALGRRSYWACSQCGIQACRACAELLEIGEHAHRRR